MSLSLKKHPLIETSQSMIQICKPIFELLDVTFFRFLRIFPDGSRIHLCTNPEWTEHFYSQKFYNVAWYDSNKKLFKSNHETLWDEKATRNDNIVGITARNQYDLYHGISIVRINQNYNDVYDFATDKNNFAINERYSTNLDLIERFFFILRKRPKILLENILKYISCHPI